MGSLEVSLQLLGALKSLLPGGLKLLQHFGSSGLFGGLALDDLFLLADKSLDLSLLFLGDSFLGWWLSLGILLLFLKSDDGLLSNLDTSLSLLQEATNSGSLGFIDSSLLVPEAFLGSECLDRLDVNIVESVNDLDLGDDTDGLGNFFL